MYSIANWIISCCSDVSGVSCSSLQVAECVYVCVCVVQSPVWCVSWLSSCSSMVKMQIPPPPALPLCISLSVEPGSSWGDLLPNVLPHHSGSRCLDLLLGICLPDHLWIHLWTHLCHGLLLVLCRGSGTLSMLLDVIPRFFSRPSSFLFLEESFHHAQRVFSVHASQVMHVCFTMLESSGFSPFRKLLLRWASQVLTTFVFGSAGLQSDEDWECCTTAVTEAGDGPSVKFIVSVVPVRISQSHIVSSQWWHQWGLVAPIFFLRSCVGWWSQVSQVWVQFLAVQ